MRSSTLVCRKGSRTSNEFTNDKTAPGKQSPLQAMVQVEHVFCVVEAGGVVEAWGGVARDDSVNVCRETVGHFAVKGSIEIRGQGGGEVEFAQADGDEHIVCGDDAAIGPSEALVAGEDD